MTSVYLAVTTLMVALQTSAPTPLLGRWDAETRSRGGLGTWMELAAGAKCSRTMGAMVDGSWTLAGDRLTLTIPDDKGPPVVQRWTSTLHGNTQTQVLDGQTRQLTRQGAASPPAPSLVGVWTYPHPAGGQAYEEYTGDGRFLFRLPMRSTDCQCIVDGDRLRITADGKTEDMRWRLAGDRLTLEGPNGSQTFHRESASTVPPASRRQ